MDATKEAIFVILLCLLHAPTCADATADRRWRSMFAGDAMADKNQNERFLRTPEAARLVGLSPRTLEKHRTYGTGPQYRKLGGRVVYALEDLRAWADLGLRQSTNDPKAGIVRAAKPLNAPPAKSPRGAR